MYQISTDKLSMLQKFGFRVEDEGYFIHKKLDVELSVEQIQDFVTLDDLENHIRSILRSS